MTCERATVHGVPIAVLQLDLSWAFDRVSHDFLLQLLQWCEVRKFTIQWISICYRELTTSLVVNGRSTRSIAVKRSVRQECPLSPILFALYLEPICRIIEADSTITGMKCEAGEVKLLAYADDVTLICTSKESIERATQEIQRFCKLSGALLNWEKTKGAWLGDWDETPTRYMGATWSTQVDTYLGVPFNQERQFSGGEMWSTRLNKLKASLTVWNGRYVSTLNRSIICNVSLYPAVLYYAQARVCSGPTTHRIHRIFATFIWRSRMEKMRRTNLFHSRLRGVFQVMNVAVKLVVHRFMLFRSEKNGHFWETLQSLGAAYLLLWIATTAVLPKKNPALGFYKDVAEAVRFLTDRFSWDYLSTGNRRKLYWDIIDVVFPSPLYRSSLSNRKDSDVSSKVTGMPIPTWIKDCFVLFHTDTLPVKTWKHAKGFIVPWSLRCDSCFAEQETPVHVFLNCRNAVQFWGEARYVAEVDSPFQWEQLKFLDFKDDARRELVEVIAVVGMHSLWAYRQDYVNCKENISTPWSRFVTTLLWTIELVNSSEYYEVDGLLRLKERLMRNSYSF
ncbi:uncharacterized protein LOC135394827 [Ornithodoros turicata]|uniref:uncharacterized protein LOC135394827 n=1 Tax=Ornithodoros turicata TaxID=34597 RepID=UPI00313900B3